ncbi:TetR/AcrR family transcriptional regulator [Polyangium jinanense]|nr:TetR/AcrR family transcriptional regulator [Polyangium jinanense]
MSTSEPQSAESTPMRSRLSPAQEQAILDTAMKLVAEVGYDLTSIDEIARRARASKATIYRRWKSKADLVFAGLLRGAQRPSEVSVGASLREDFILALSAFCATVTSGKDLLIGLMSVFHAHPELWRLVREQFVKREQASIIGVLERAVARGEIPAMPKDPTKIIEVAMALTSHRLLLLRAPLDADFVTYVVDEVLLPLLDAQLIRSPRRIAAPASPSSPPEAKPAARKRRPD